nr:aminotransferase class IV [Clostridium aestuarii]
MFETILIKDKPVFLKEHLHRLNAGLVKIGIKTQISEQYCLGNIKKLNCSNCAVKIVVSENNIIFTKREIGYKEEDYINGFKVKISDITRNTNSYITYLKSLNYLDNIIEREKALKEGYNEVLFFNNNGYLSEGSVSNLFFIREGNICTPSLKCGLLPGVVRNWIISNFKVLQGKFILEDLKNSEGVFLTNSLMGIMQIYSIEEKILNKSDIIRSIKSKYESVL